MEISGRFKDGVEDSYSISPKVLEKAIKKFNKRSKNHKMTYSDDKVLVSYESCEMRGSYTQKEINLHSVGLVNNPSLL